MRTFVLFTDVFYINVNSGSSVVWSSCVGDASVSTPNVETQPKVKDDGQVFVVYLFIYQ